MDEEFGRFVAARGRALCRTAFLLTGDWQVGEDLVQETLTRTYLRRRRLDGALDLVGVRVRRRQRVGLVAAEHALLRTARRIALDLDAGALVLASVLRLASYLDRSATLLDGPGRRVVVVAPRRRRLRIILERASDSE